MKISTKGRYGLRTLIDLAVHEDEAPISLAIIAERQGISMNYLEQVFAILKRASLVKSIKGAQGGYKLLCNPKEIQIKEILTLLEGDLSIVEYDDKREEETLLQKCIREALWEQIDVAVDRILGTLTLQDMIEEYQTLKNGCTSKLYTIEF
ncbi:MAG: RrF2 family transcriptional regulator [Cellulosilyticaceae bacterium]